MLGFTGTASAASGGTPASRFYLPSTGAAPVSPAFSAGWTGTATADRRAAVTTRINSAMTNEAAPSETTSAIVEWILIRQYVSAPLAAQTITGTVKGQARCNQSSGSKDATLALGIRVFSGDGLTERGVLLAPSASDATGAPFEFVNTTNTNRKFYDASESSNLTLSSVVAQAGDVLVFEIGYREPATHVSITNATVVFGDDSGTDLPEDSTTTTANNPWIEFSSPVTMQ